MQRVQRVQLAVAHCRACLRDQEVRRVVRQNQRLVWQWKRQWEGREEDRRAGQQERVHQGQVVVLLVVVVLVVVPGGLLVLHSMPLESCVRWVER